MLACEFTITKRSSSESGMKLSQSVSVAAHQTSNRRRRRFAISSTRCRSRVAVSTISKGDAVRILSME